MGYVKPLNGLKGCGFLAGGNLIDVRADKTIRSMRFVKVNMLQGIYLGAREHHAHCECKTLPLLPRRNSQDDQVQSQTG